MLKNRTALPLVDNENVNVAFLLGRMKPSIQTVSSEELVDVYDASSIHICVALELGIGGELLDNVD